MKPHATHYRSARHSVFLLHAHLVFTPKYRKAIFCGEHLEAMLKSSGNTLSSSGDQAEKPGRGIEPRPGMPYISAQSDRIDPRMYVQRHAGAVATLPADASV